MTTVAYQVQPAGEAWPVMRDGRESMSYASRSAAYEVAVAEAEDELRLGHDVVIKVLCGDESAAPKTSAGETPRR